MALRVKIAICCEFVVCSVPIADTTDAGWNAVMTSTYGTAGTRFLTAIKLDKDEAGAAIGRVAANENFAAQNQINSMAGVQINSSNDVKAVHSGRVLSRAVGNDPMIPLNPQVTEFKNYITRLNMDSQQFTHRVYNRSSEFNAIAETICRNAFKCFG